MCEYFGAAYSASLLYVSVFEPVLNIGSPYDPAVSFQDIYAKNIQKTKTLIWKDTCIPMFIAALFTMPRSESNLRGHQQMNE